MKLTQKQRDQLWGEHGPYSEAKLITETRILDDQVSRVFVVVEVAINPLTYEIIGKNIKQCDGFARYKRINITFLCQKQFNKYRRGGKW
ncbi:hypothetical protein HYW82_04155 [Candidatus Peregrinibacteria bacterium]|nr:hypothetical protein [Candidatus Peregrinibacteria bacterium]